MSSTMEISKASLSDLTVQYEMSLAAAPQSIFYSMRKMEGMNVLESYYRLRYDWRALGRCYVSPDTWRVIKWSDGPVTVGEDPRMFHHGGKTYVLDNSWAASALMCPDEGFRRIGLPSNGKNYTLISHGSSVLCVEWFRPLRVHECTDLEKGEWKLKIMRDSDSDISFRGGTVGYLCKEAGIYFGFGHKTDIGESVRHVPYLWILDANKWTITTKIIDAPCFANAIVDPTSLVMHDGKLFMVTAESQLPWFQPQDYHTRIYSVTLGGGS
jgi:hypothetical protein